MNFKISQNFHKIYKYSKIITRNVRYNFHQEPEKANCKVAVIGATSPVGQSVSLMLKQSPQIDVLSLYDERPIEVFAKDLNIVDTNCVVVAAEGKKNLPKVLKDAKIVVVVCLNKNHTPGSKATLETMAPMIRITAKQIAESCPNALIALAIEPINSVLPFFTENYRKFATYNPYTIFGITTLTLVRANRLVAEFLNMDPECVDVPIIGGNSEVTMVPLLSHTEPCKTFTESEIQTLTKHIRCYERLLEKNISKETASDMSPLSTAFAITRFVFSLLKAVLGVPNVTEIAYVRNPSHPLCRYFASPLLLGPGGIVKNLQIPSLSEYEQCQLDEIYTQLVDDIKYGENLGGKPICDECDPKPPTAKCPVEDCSKTMVVGFKS